MLQVRAKIIYNNKVGGGYFHLALRAPGVARESLPGQFLNIKVSDGCEPLLRRPLSIHRLKGADIEFLYEVLGKGTQILSQRKDGEYLDVIGPLGNGFNYKPIVSSHVPGVLVAGGMGVAPLLFLAERLLKLQAPGPKLQTQVLIGAKTAAHILCEKEFRALGCKVKIATDDGSRGFRGKVTDLLKDILGVRGYGLRITVYACGPRPMLKKISIISREYSVPAQVSLEEHMACGIGACLGCAVNTKGGFKRICKEGPVLDADEIIW